MMPKQRCQRIALLTGLSAVFFSALSLSSVDASQSKQTQPPTKAASKQSRRSAKKRSLPKSPVAVFVTPLNRRFLEMDTQSAREWKQISDRMGREAEAELKHWKPGPDNAQTPRTNLRCTDTSLEGHWSYGTGFDSAEFYFYMRQGQTFPVFLVTGGCCGQWELQRTARYENGSITLDRPVKTYLGLVYNRLYTLRVGGTDYLVPDLCVAEFEKALSPDGTSVRQAGVQCLTRE